VTVKHDPGIRNRRIFQIAYTQSLLFTRAELLKTRGYEVTSVCGNDAAKRVLDRSQNYSLFLVGHDAPRESKEEMVRWLRENFPETKLLALNAPHQEHLTGVDVNVVMNGAEEWLAAVEGMAA
jgi:DNA-binding response OmpR family regulator